MNAAIGLLFFFSIAGWATESIKPIHPIKNVEFFRSHDCELVYSDNSKVLGKFKLSDEVEQKVQGTLLIKLYDSFLISLSATVATFKQGDEEFLTISAAEKVDFKYPQVLGRAATKVDSGRADLTLFVATHYFPERSLRIHCKDE